MHSLETIVVLEVGQASHVFMHLLLGVDVERKARVKRNPNHNVTHTIWKV